MISRIYLAMWMILVVLGVGCKYEPDDIYEQNVTPPAQVHQFDLGLIPENDTIKVFNITKFRCNIQTFGLQIHKGVYSIGSNKWEVFHEQDTFSINPAIITAGIYELTLDLYTSSGSGSIADIVGSEGYIAKKKWTVIIDGRYPEEIEPFLDRSEEGYLKIAWPKCGQYNFKYYELTVSHSFANEQKIIIERAEQCFYIDTLFAGGDIHIGLRTYVFTNNYSRTSGLTEEVPIPKLYIEELSIDSIRAFWTKSKFNCKYTLSYYNHYNVLFTSITDTSVVIQNPGFAERTDYYLSISSECSSVYGSTLTSEVKRYVLGEFLNTGQLDFGYSKTQKTLFFCKYDNLLAYDIQLMQQISSYQFSTNLSNSDFACQSNSTKLAFTKGTSIIFFDNNYFSNPQLVSYSNGGYGIDHVCYTDNNYLGLAAKDKYELMEITSKTIVTSIPISDYPYYSKWACFSTSRDGKYATYCTRNGLWIYNIFEGNDELVYSDARSYRSVLFNTNSPSQLFLTLYDSDIMEIRSAEDFSLIQQVILPSQSQVLCNIDPESGNLLLTDFSNIFVYNISSNEIVFKIKSSDIRPKLFNNRLFSFNGYHLDISQYLIK